LSVKGGKERKRVAGWFAFDPLWFLAKRGRKEKGGKEEREKRGGGTTQPPGNDLDSFLTSMLMHLREPALGVKGKGKGGEKPKKIKTVYA